MDRIYDDINFISKKNFILRRPAVAIFADVNRRRNYVSNCSLYLYFFIYQNLLISGEKMLI